MKLTNGLPTIYETSKTQYNNSLTEGNNNNNPYNTRHFTMMMRKYQQKKLIPINTTGTSIQRIQTDPTELLEMEEEEKKANVKNEKSLIKIYESNASSVIQKIRDEYGNENEKMPVQVDKRYGFAQFRDTNYIEKNCMKEFFNKYQKFKILNRKQPIEKITPSFAFIKSSNEEKIVPNPLGLLRRSGEDTILRMNFQKVGDNYAKCLSNSLKYSKHLKSLELANNRLTSDGTTCILKSVNENRDLLPKIFELDLSENKILESDIGQLINFLNDEKCNLENLNLYGNLLGDDNIKLIAEALGKNISYRLIYLSLGQNNIGDDSVPSIIDMFNTCTGMRTFNLSHNKISNKFAGDLIKKLKSHSELKVLDLAWNNIGNNFSKPIIYETLVNQNLTEPNRVFNNHLIQESIQYGKFIFRRNPLLPPLDQKGNAKKDDKKKGAEKPKITEPKKVKEPTLNPSAFANELGAYFKEKGVTLVHLDISHNNLPAIDCEYLANQSKDNHIILGMHVDGNEMNIDALGFLHPLYDKEEKYFANSQLSYPITKEYSLRKSHIDNVRHLRGLNRCWICDGYREIEFTFVPKEPIIDATSHIVKIHLNFDDYQPFGMHCLGSKYQIVRMCPPGEISYFFTVDTIPVEEEGEDGKNEIIELNKNRYFNISYDSEYMDELNNIRARLLYEKRQKDEAKEKEIIEKGGNPDEHKEEEELSPAMKVLYTEPSPTEVITVTVKKVSKKIININRNVVDEYYNKQLRFAEPRPPKIINRFVKPRTPWSFPISIWAYYGYEYEGDDESYLDQCFEFDFNRCLFNKDFKDEAQLAELKKMLRVRYRDIIDCYKYYASMSGFTVWQITQNSLTEFISKCPGMCDKTYDINNVYLTQKVVCANQFDINDRKKNNNKNLSDNIVRHQFMNLLVKAAKDKYVTCLKTTNDVLEATKISFEQHYDPAIKGFEYHKWRMERYYNEEVDYFLKAYLPILDALYMSWAKQKGPRKKDVWMVCDEFNNLVQSFVDVNEYPVRDNPLIFNYAIRLQVNEIYTDKHLNMYLPEFLEALCRAVDKASPYPPGDSPDDWPKEKRAAQPLVNKLENVIGKLIKLITHPDYKVLKEKFPTPEKEIGTGIYKPNYENPFYQGYIIKINPREAKRRETRRKTQLLKQQENAELLALGETQPIKEEGGEINNNDLLNEEKKDIGENPEGEINVPDIKGEEEKKEEEDKDNLKTAKPEDNIEENKEEVKEEVKEEETKGGDGFQSIEVAYMEDEEIDAKETKF